MNQKSYLLAKRFYKKYGPAERVLEVGSLDCNGTIKRIFKDCEYVGTDKTAGKNVDIVCTDVLPFEDNSFDMVVTTDCFEHDPQFWLTFNEMVRVCSNVIYLQAPATQRFHPCHGGDYWRFQQGCWDAFAKWNDKVYLVETWYGRKRGHNLGVFFKK